MKIQDLVKKLRIEKGLTLRDFCRKMGIDAANWSKAERGLIPFPKHRIADILKVLDIKKGTAEYESIHVKSRNFDSEDLISFVNFYLDLQGIDKRHQLENLSIIYWFMMHYNKDE